MEKHNPSAVLFSEDSSGKWEIKSEEYVFTMKQIKSLQEFFIENGELVKNSDELLVPTTKNKMTSRSEFLQIKGVKTIRELLTRESHKSSS